MADKSIYKRLFYTTGWLGMSLVGHRYKIRIELHRGTVADTELTLAEFHRGRN
jgi:hypothetical protein